MTIAGVDIFSAIDQLFKLNGWGTGGLSMFVLYFAGQALRKWGNSVEANQSTTETQTQNSKLDEIAQHLVLALLGEKQSDGQPTAINMADIKGLIGTFRTLLVQHKLPQIDTEVIVAKLQAVVGNLVGVALKNAANTSAPAPPK